MDGVAEPAFILTSLGAPHRAPGSEQTRRVLSGFALPHLCSYTVQDSPALYWHLLSHLATWTDWVSPAFLLLWWEKTWLSHRRNGLLQKQVLQQPDVSVGRSTWCRH